MFRRVAAAMVALVGIGGQDVVWMSHFSFLISFHSPPIITDPAPKKTAQVSPLVGGGGNNISRNTLNTLNTFFLLFHFLMKETTL